MKIDRPRAIIVIFAILGIALAAYTPLTSLFLALNAPWIEVIPQLLRSLALAASIGLIATASGAACALILWEGIPRRMRKNVTDIIYIISGIPSTVVAMAVLLLFRNGISLAHVSVALALHTVPFAARYMLEALESLPPYAMEALHAMGASRIRTIVDGLIPHAKYSIVSTFLYACSRVFTEVAILSVLAVPPASFLSVELVRATDSPATYPAAFMLCAIAMFLYDRARFPRGRQVSR